jgi:hypothetical protein
MTPVEIALRQAEQDLAVAEKSVMEQQLLVRAAKRGTPAREDAERELTRLLEAYGLARSARDARLHEAIAAGSILGLKREKRVKR